MKKCGHASFDDFQEYQDGAVDELAKDMERHAGVKAAIISRNQVPHPNQPRFRLSDWLHSATRSISFALKEAHRPEILLPHHVDSRITTGGATEPVDPPAQLPARHLMMNIHRAKYHVELFQEQIQNIASDRDLFRFLKERFKTHRGRYLGVIPKRRVRLIHFVKVSK
jgi:hypothetical protein